MKLSKEIKGRIIVFFLAIILAGGMLAANYIWLRPGGTTTFDGGEKSVTLKISYANFVYTYENLDASDVNTVLELLKKFDKPLDLGLKYTTSEFGAFVEELKGTPNNEKKGYYYTYTINGEFADGISMQTLSDGDLIEFEYLFEEWHEVDGEWVLKESKLIGGKYDKKPLYITISLAAMLLVFAMLYLFVSFLKAKQGNK